MDIGKEREPKRDEEPQDLGKTEREGRGNRYQGCGEISGEEKI